MPADVDESVHAGETPEAYVRRIAEAKARAVVPRADGRAVLAADTVVVVDDVILGKPADRQDAKRMLRLLSGRPHQVITAVTLLCGADPPGPRGGPGRSAPHVAGQGRPGRSAPHVAGQGRPGRSAPHVAGQGGPGRLAPHVAGQGGPGRLAPQRVTTRIETTDVEFAPLTDGEIDWYVKTGEPDDKAGAYAIQGLASRFIASVSGSYSNVVGLPVSLVQEMLQAAGFRP